jgi:hypothetical protein
MTIAATAEPTIRGPLIRALASTCTALAVVLAVAAPAGARSTHPWLGIYDCVTAGSGYTNVYAGSARLMKNGSYQYATDRVAGRLKGVTTGRYKVQGRNILFITGVFHKGHWYGQWYGPTSLHRDGYFAVNRNRDHVWTGETCYPTNYR